MKNRGLDYNIIAKYVSGECSAKEIITIRMKMETDIRFTKAVIDFEKIWKARKSQPADQWDKKGVWGKIEQEIKKNEARISPIKPIITRKQFDKKENRSMGWVIRIAAVFLVAAITSLFTILYMQDIRVDEPSLMREVVTENGQRATIHLDDGSRIKLNSGSSLSHPRDFNGENRVVYLNGEGYFEIARDNRPFFVYADHAVIEILGTEFNVSAYDDLDEINVVVTDGIVSMYSEKSEINEIAVLGINDMGSMKRIGNGDIQIIHNVNPQNHLGWINYRMQFDNTPMSEVINKLERWYGVEIDVTDNEIKEMKLTAEFKDESIHQVLRVVEIALDIQYKNNGRRVKLFN
jgi:transmembrane sensor